MDHHHVQLGWQSPCPWQKHVLEQAQKDRQEQEQEKRKFTLLTRLPPSKKNSYYMPLARATGRAFG